jgi:hypothetical protein
VQLKRCIPTAARLGWLMLWPTIWGNRALDAHCRQAWEIHAIVFDSGFERSR